MMKDMAFDGISREFSSVSTRRGFLRVLGGMTAVAAVGAAGKRESAEARRKKKVKGTGKAQEICRSWVISGGQGTNDPIAVDDDLQITLNGALILNNADKMAGNIPAVRFQAKAGDSLGVVATDVYASCRHLSPLWLHCESTGQRRQLTPGQPDGCAPDRTPGVFFSRTFQVKV
jgi:hypothetical protein